MGWSRFYWTTDDPPFARVNIASAKAQNNRHRDFVISQGFQTSHEESTIGVDETSRKHCSDAHNMVTLRGDFPRHQSSVSLPAPTSSTQSGHAPTDPLGTHKVPMNPAPGLPPGLPSLGLQTSASGSVSPPAPSPATRSCHAPTGHLSTAPSTQSTGPPPRAEEAPAPSSARDSLEASTASLTQNPCQ